MNAVYRYAMRNSVPSIKYLGRVEWANIPKTEDPAFAKSEYYTVEITGYESMTSTFSFSSILISSKAVILELHSGTYVISDYTVHDLRRLVDRNGQTFTSAILIAKDIQRSA